MNALLKLDFRSYQRVSNNRYVTQWMILGF